MPQNSPYTLEICVEAPSALAACCDDADRIELCSGLDVGGLTPSIGLMELAALSGVETHVLIRERSGNFAMTATDITSAVASIRVVREMGLHGVVIGAEQDGVLAVHAKKGGAPEVAHLGKATLAQLQRRNGARPSGTLVAARRT